MAQVEVHESGYLLMYGNPVLEWRRPGGSALATTRQGSQADLSLPPSRIGVSYSKHGGTAQRIGQDPARENVDGSGFGASR